jgi:glutaredoxin
MPRKVQVIIYTRRGCHLCEEARGEILKAGRRDAYTLEEVDIETDPELVRRYGWEIPVVAIDGAIVFKYRVTADEFVRQIKQAQAD